MNHFFTGTKTNLSSCLLFTFVFFSAYYSQAFWLPLQAFFTHSFYLLTAILVVFAAQFSQSRFSILALLLLVLFLSNQLSSPLLSAWQANGEWQILASVTMFAYLAWCKDRGLCSIHFFFRLISLAVCVLLAFAYLMLINTLINQYEQVSWLIQYQHWLNIYSPMSIAFVAMLIPCLQKKHLFQPALLVTAVLTVLFYFDALWLSWSATLVLLLLYFLLSVIISSYFLAYRDELTGLPSRRALYQTSLSLGRKYSVAMMDIDHFKKFNDTYGHDIGDQVLKLVATQLAKVKSGGRVFRYGGEEFTVIFPRKQAEQTLQELETLRQAIADYQMVIRQPVRVGKDGRKMKKSANTKSVSVTISIGVATRLPKQNFEQVMKTADKKLYQAKKNGRNNVTS